MKKKILLWGAVALAAVFLVAMLFKLGEGSGNEAPTLPPEETPQPTETWPEAIFENGAFTFTGGQLEARFGETLPQGYGLGREAKLIEENDKELEYPILKDSGEETGMWVRLNAQTPEEPCNRLSLVAETDTSAEEFAQLLEWYLNTFFTGVAQDRRALVQESYREIFAEGKTEPKVFAVKAHTAVMALDADRYYVLITIH